MERKPLPNESTKGLSLFLRCVLIAAEILILAFVYALAQTNGPLWLALSLAAFIAAGIVIYFFEKTLRDDAIIRHAYEETKTFSLWRFARLVFVGAGLWVIVLSLWEKIR